MTLIGCCFGRLALPCSYAHCITILCKRENKTHSVSVREINGKEVWFCSFGKWKINSVKRNLTHLKKVNAWITRPGGRIRNIYKNTFSSFVKLGEYFETAVKGQCVSKKTVIWEKWCCRIVYSLITVFCLLKVTWKLLPYWLIMVQKWLVKTRRVTPHFMQLHPMGRLTLWNSSLTWGWRYVVTCTLFLSIQRQSFLLSCGCC